MRHTQVCFHRKLRSGRGYSVASREFDSAVGQRLREWRAKRGFSQYLLAGTVGITQASLSNYETGKRELPLGTALRLTAPLDITLSELLPIDEIIFLRDSRLAAAMASPAVVGLPAPAG
jgi:transcriptional regulator with XRE-family HTH domain